jgi:hypothetical protein
MSRFVCGSSQFGEVCTLPARVHSWSNTLIIKLGNPCSHSCVKGIHLIHRGIVASLLRGTGAGNNCCDSGLVNNPAQRQLRRRYAGWSQRGEFTRGLDPGIKVDPAERFSDVERLAVPIV